MQKVKLQEVNELTAMKINFMGLMQANKYDQAQQIANQILTIDPTNKTIKKFELFLKSFKDTMKVIDNIHAAEEKEWENKDWEYEDSAILDQQEQLEEIDQDEEDDTQPEDEEAQGYGYNDPENPQYDTAKYEIQKQHMLANLQDGNDIQQNIRDAIKQSETKTNQKNDNQQKVTQTASKQQVQKTNPSIQCKKQTKPNKK